MYIRLGECGVVWCGVVCGACIVYGRSPGIHWLLTAAFVSAYRVKWRNVQTYCVDRLVIHLGANSRAKLLSQADEFWPPAPHLPCPLLGLPQRRRPLPSMPRSGRMKQACR